MPEDIEKCLEPKWVEKDDVIYATLSPTTGRTGEEWITHFGDEVSNRVKRPLRSEKFKPTMGVVYRTAILRGLLWGDSFWITEQIQEDAHAEKFTRGQKLFDPSVEVACLTCAKFLRSEIVAMNLDQVVAIHDPMEDLYGTPGVLRSNSCLFSRRIAFAGLDMAGAEPEGRWRRENGFIFVISQVRSCNFGGTVLLNH